MCIHINLCKQIKSIGAIVIELAAFITIEFFLIRNKPIATRTSRDHYEVHYMMMNKRYACGCQILQLRNVRYIYLYDIKQIC